MTSEYPLICEIGDRGTGKTNLSTALAYLYSQYDCAVYANYNLYDIPYTHITFDEVASLPEWLHDGLLILDEAHLGMDAYSFWKTISQQNAILLTQLRKRRITLIIITQIYTQVAKRARNLVNYIFECHKVPSVDGAIKIRIFDRSQVATPNYLVRELIIDGRPFWGMYDTNQIIEAP